MNTDLVYIEGDLPPDQRERFLSLLRRAKQVGDFRDQGPAANWSCGGSLLSAGAMGMKGR